jgi:type VI protein secretion system component Hcp
MNIPSSATGLVAAMAVLLMAGPLQAQVLLQVDGIPGESVQPNHTNWIECVTFQQNVIRSGPDPASHYVTLWKDLDRASPLLHELVAVPSTIPRVVLHFTRPEAGHILRYEMVFSNVTFVAARFVRNNLNDVEELSFLYQMVQWTYYIDPDLPEPSTYADPTVHRSGFVTNDFDQDGMADIVDPDDDDDQSSDADEFIAGTKAEDPGSFFRVTYIQKSETNAILEWTSSQDRWYRIHQADSVDGPYHQDIPNLIYSHGDGITSMEVPISPPVQFYRVTVER